MIHNAGTAASPRGYNGIHLLWRAIHELMDGAPDDQVRESVLEIAKSVPEVVEVEKHWIRKYGTGYIVDLHVVVPGDLTVREGHAIAHKVKDALVNAGERVIDVLVHIEPEN